MSYRTKLKHEEGRGWIAEIIDDASATVCTTSYWDKKAMAEDDAEFFIDELISKDMARKRRIKKEHIDRILEDAERAHAVFDLCNVRKLTHGNQPMPLSLRALCLTEAAGFMITQEQVTAQVEKRRSSD